MARSQQKVNVTVRGMLTVYDSLNAPVLGLTGVSFSKLISLNGVDQGAYSTTITEVGNGRYSYTYVPNAVGYWHLLFINTANNPRGWQDEFDVS